MSLKPPVSREDLHMVQELIPRAMKTRLKSFLSSSRMTPFSSFYRGVATCLMYHRITPEIISDSDFRPNIGLSVRVSDFEAQMRYLAENFNCLSLDEGVAQLRNGFVGEHFVMVTFDDGYRDNLEYALPILERYKVPATIYASTGLADGTSNLWWYEHEFILSRLNHIEYDFEGVKISRRTSTLEEKLTAWHELNRLFKRLDPETQETLLIDLRKQPAERFSYEREMLSWSDLRELSRHPLITIGAHTRQHAVLSQLREDLLEQELLTSKRVLEERLETEVRHFSYPFGQRSEASFREFEAAQRAGFESAFTTRAGHIQHRHRKHLFSLPRITIDYHDGTDGFLWKLSGMEAMIHQRGRRFVAN